MEKRGPDTMDNFTILSTFSLNYVFIFAFVVHIHYAIVDLKFL